MQTVYTCSLQFPSVVDSTPILYEIRKWIEGWYAKNEPAVQLPPDWSSGVECKPTHNHQLSLKILQLENVQIGALHEIRWRHPDDQDSSLFWRTKVSLHSSEAGTLLTLVIRIESDESVVIPTRPLVGTPRIIRTLVGRGDAHIGKHALSAAPICLSASEVESFVDFLESKDRLHPVVLVSVDPMTEKPIHDTKKLAEMVAGSASVYVMESKWAGFALTDELGKVFSCFNGAIRLYWPRFSRLSNPRSHQLWMAPELSTFSVKDFSLELLNIIASAAAYRFVEPNPLRVFRATYDQQRLWRMKEAMKGKRDYDELFAEWEKSQQEIEEQVNLINSLLEDVDSLKQEIEDQRAENNNLKQNLEACQAYPSESSASLNPENVPQDPESFASVLDAVKFASSETKNILYLDDAFTSAAESPYKNPRKVLSALRAIDEIAGKWINQLNGGPPIGSRGKLFLQRAFAYKDDISEITKGNYGEEYTYSYNGNRVLFAPHITIGAKQATKCISIHLFWDETNQRIVVAHIGRHKTNTLT